MLRVQGLITSHLTSPKPPGLLVFTYFPSFSRIYIIYIHVCANIGQLDKWSCQIVSLITDDITICNNDNIGVKSTCLCFNDVSLFFNVFF